MLGENFLECRVDETEKNCIVLDVQAAVVTVTVWTACLSEECRLRTRSEV